MVILNCGFLEVEEARREALEALAALAAHEQCHPTLISTSIATVSGMHSRPAVAECAVSLGMHGTDCRTAAWGL